MLKRWLATLRRAPEFDAAEWVPRRLARPALYSSLPVDAVDALRRTHPRRVAATIASAERVLRHEFELLGSGPFVPRDPDRAARGTYVPIDWYLDPVRQLRFPRGIPYKDWKLYEMRPRNADIKYPWELARCQHWATLGQAFLFTRDERFAQEIARELDDFVEANPLGIGVNWTCTMDVAIRAVNWAIGLELVRSSTSLDSGFWQRAYRALYDTGVFTRANLENTYEVTSNHFLSNVVGLWFLGAVFDDVPAGQEWLAFARTALEQEMAVQVLPDGADYESSVAYHRLVAELFLGSMRLAEFRGTPLSQTYRRRMHDMIAFLAAVMRPDRLMPQVGDADDGRLHVLTGIETPQDPRHLLGPAAAMFDEPAWQSLAGEDGSWEAAWWALAPSAALAVATSPRSHLFPDAGLAVMRAGDHYLLATNGIVGTRGFGNHKHNDQLSFEYHHGGVPVVVDPGSYVYTSDFDARNRFRSTASHNTLQVDDLEQNEMKAEWIFRLFETARAEHIAFSEDDSAVSYTGRHHGYERGETPVLHERMLLLSKADGSLIITDTLSASGSCRVRWHFHFAPGIEAVPVDAATVECRHEARRWLLSMPEAVDHAIREAQYSPSYGVVVPCLALDVTTHATIAGRQSWTFTIRAR